MRALTLTQPWAGLVASGIKLVENRPRSMIKREDFGKPFAIHASREIDEPTYDRIYEIAPELRGTYLVEHHNGLPPWSKLSRITSAVIAVATIEDAIILPILHDRHGPVARGTSGEVDLGDQARWFFGPIGYVLRDVIALPTPVYCRGAQGFWTLSAEVEAKVRTQLRPAPTAIPGAGVKRHD